MPGLSVRFAPSREASRPWSFGTRDGGSSLKASFPRVVVYVKNGEREPLVSRFVSGWRAVWIAGAMVWLVAVTGGLIVG